VGVGITGVGIAGDSRYTLIRELSNFLQFDHVNDTIRTKRET